MVKFMSGIFYHNVKKKIMVTTWSPLGKGYGGYEYKRKHMEVTILLEKLDNT